VPVIPFIVTTTTTTINGVTVNPGVYINGAFIQGGSIQGSNIAGGTIENSKLINVSANKITGAALEATSYIESAAYIANYQGWKIHADGFAEFGASSIRGQLTAGQIDTRNLTIKDSSGNVLFGAGTNLSGLGAGAFATLSQITGVNISTYIAGAAIDTAYIKNLAVKTALIDNLAVTNAKIDNLAVTSAKIDNLAVTSAKIGNAEVGTLKIAGNAVTVPGGASGVYSAQVFLTTDATTTFSVITSFTQGLGKNGHNWYLAINGTDYRNENPIEFTTGSMTYTISLATGTHNFSIYTIPASGSSACGITVIGVKR